MPTLQDLVLANHFQCCPDSRVAKHGSAVADHFEERERLARTTGHKIHSKQALGAVGVRIAYPAVKMMSLRAWLHTFRGGGDQIHVTATDYAQRPPFVDAPQTTK